MITPCTVHATSTTTRWRNLRRINSANSSPHSRAEIAAHDPSAPNTVDNASRPGRCQPANQRTIVSSTTVTVTAAPRNSPANTTTNNDTNPAAATNQPTPVARNGRGNGGGCPDGRRRPAGPDATPARCSTSRPTAPGSSPAGTPITPPNPCSVSQAVDAQDRRQA